MNEAAAAPVALLGPRDFAAYLKIRPRTFATWRAAGKLPPPDLACGKVLRWRIGTVARWLDEQARRAGGQT